MDGNDILFYKIITVLYPFNMSFYKFITPFKHYYDIFYAYKKS